MLFSLPIGVARFLSGSDPQGHYRQAKWPGQDKSVQIHFGLLPKWPRSAAVMICAIARFLLTRLTQHNKKQHIIEFSLSIVSK
jgi:hypothetical protein